VSNARLKVNMEAGRKRKAANAPETPSADGASALKKIKLLVCPPVHSILPPHSYYVRNAGVAKMRESVARHDHVLE